MLKTGARLQSQVCSTQVIIVRAGSADVALQCGGYPMLELSETPAEGLTAAAGFAEGTAIGKRYVNADGTVEVLATKAGAGSLALDGTALTLKAAKPLPSSD
ncbi:hypothetical protein OG874_17755 [Nocardia sp. NBC_00565]|uniref:hypothetical protein n=1 Tax=Nocardia sp. NBC_00565 TaxID=2975993 RepID=UPI002E80841C|nr:hypothetical protein [Nocardia sp. NBC_00565]WUC06839.1 hypothetical protein OG874_17755 [Nocardia sp. NBC_00565]